MVAMTNSISIEQNIFIIQCDCLVNRKYIMLTQSNEIYLRFGVIYRSHFYEIKLTVQLLVYLNTWQAGWRMQIAGRWATVGFKGCQGAPPWGPPPP